MELKLLLNISADIPDRFTFKKVFTISNSKELLLLQAQSVFIKLYVILWFKFKHHMFDKLFLYTHFGIGL